MKIDNVYIEQNTGSYIMVNYMGNQCTINKEFVTFIEGGILIDINEACRNKLIGFVPSDAFLDSIEMPWEVKEQSLEELLGLI